MSTGQKIGLVVSIAFMAWAVVSLSFGQIRSYGQFEIQVFFALMILFSGPIAFFWITTGNEASFKLNWGKLIFVVGGSYAVAFGIAAFVRSIGPLTPSVVWQTIELDTDASRPDQVIAHLQKSAAGHVWVTTEEVGNSVHSEKVWAMIVRFDGYDPELVVKLNFYNRIADGHTLVHVPRDGSLKESPHLEFASAATSQSNQ
jgi:hypothetical protein